MTKTVFDRVEMPPAAQLLGWRLKKLDVEAGTIEVTFDAKPEFANPAGYVQGGLLAAMLDDTLGPAAFAAAGGNSFVQTVDLHTHFLNPARPGPLTGRAQVVKLGRTIAFIEGALFDKNDDIIARASCSAVLRPMVS